MSGTPKYSQAELDRQRQERLEAERRQQAEAEARRRAEAAERERQRRLAKRRQQADRDLQALSDRLAQADAYPSDRQSIQAQLAQLQPQIARATEEAAVHQALAALNDLSRHLDRAIDRKRRDDEEKKRRDELDKQRFALEELERAIARIPAAEAAKFDPEGQQATRHAIETAQRAIAKGNPEAARAPLAQAQQIATQHSDRVAERQAQWQQRLAQAEQAQGDIASLLAGLQADAVVMRWCGAGVSQAQDVLSQAEAAIRAEDFARVGDLLSQLQARSQTLLAEANAAQLKADKRDFIADSMAQVLQDMGFAIVQRDFEHPDHPASAIVMAAANNAGKGIAISVPTEGQVFYDVEGYPKNLAAAVCDEAETVLNEMHDMLAEQFGIQMGEVMWEGKDPNRTLRRADELPRSTNQRDRRA